MIINMINKPLITKGLESAENEAKANIQECVENYFDTILDKIHDEYNAYAQNKVDAMRHAIDDDLDSSEKDTIIANKSKIEEIIEAL
jgi:LPS O-antigen subunit length determinant protein (WzzB/FepE family)